MTSRWKFIGMIAGLLAPLTSPTRVPAQALGDLMGAETPRTVAEAARPGTTPAPALDCDYCVPCDEVRDKVIQVFDPGGDPIEEAIGGDSCSSMVDCDDAIPCAAEEQEDFADRILMGPTQVDQLRTLVAGGDLSRVASLAQKYAASVKLVAQRDILVVRAACGEVIAAVQLAEGDGSRLVGIAAELADPQ